VRREFCYLPILRAKQGEFRALGALSPLARSRLLPLFDVPIPVLRADQTMEAYLSECASGVHVAWGRARPVLVDIHDVPPDWRMDSGAHPVTYLFDLLRSLGMSAVPVAGTSADRGDDYIQAVRRIADSDRRGACLRLVDDDLAEPHTLADAINITLSQLRLGSADADIILDLRSVGTRNLDTLRATALEAIQALSSVGEFRNMVIAGGSVPQHLGKRDAGVVRRVPRREFDLWVKLAMSVGGDTPIAFSDYGVIYPHYVPPDKRVIVPPRVRYTTLRDHAFYRGKLGEYWTLCEQVTGSSDFSGADFSEGDRVIGLCALGNGGPGNASGWVAVDTNHHLELVSAQAWQSLHDAGQMKDFLIPQPDLQPWLQPALV
jgi:hypothetical protein